MITSRQEKLLDFLIREYITTAEPVSSKVLKKVTDLAVCGATIRNDLQVLTKEGYIEQPHTSAGRIPTQKAYKHFANKIWNASRFVLENLSEASGDLIPEDQKIMEEFGELVKDITADMEGYRFYLAAEKIYHYFWHTFADIIIEKKKKEEDKRILKILLEEQLKLLHPFMPFITEKIWSMMGDRDGLLLVEKWPV